MIDLSVFVRYVGQVVESAEFRGEVRRLRETLQENCEQTGSIVKVTAVVPFDYGRGQFARIDADIDALNSDEAEKAFDELLKRSAAIKSLERNIDDPEVEELFLERGRLLSAVG